MIFEEHAFFYLRELLMCCLRPVELLPWCPPSNMEKPWNRSLKGHECTWKETGETGQTRSYKNELFEYKHPSLSGTDAWPFHLTTFPDK